MRSADRWKNRMLAGLAFGLASPATLTLVSVLPQRAVAQIPDDIDFQKYWQIHLRDKSVSDELRSTANSARANSDARIAAVRDNQNSQSTNRSRRSSNVSEANDLESERPSVLAEANRLERERVALESEVSDLGRRLSWLRSEQQNADRALRVAESNYSTAVSRKQSADRALAESEKKLARLRDDLAQIQKRLASARDEVARLDQELASLPNQVQQLRGQAERERGNLRDAREQQRSAKAELDALEPQLRAEREKLRAARQANQQAKAEVERLEPEVERLRGEKQQLAAQIDQAQAQRDRAEKQVERLTGEVAETQAEIARLEGEEASPERDRKLARAQQQLSNQQQRLSAASSEFDNAKREIGVLRDRRQAVDARLDPAVAQLHSARQRFEGTKGDVDSAQASVASLEARVAPLEQRFRAAQARVDTLLASVTQLESELAAKERRLSEVQSQRGNLASEISTLENRVRGTDDEIRAELRRLDEAQSLVRRMNSELTTASVELDRRRGDLNRIDQDVSAIEWRYRETDSRRVDTINRLNARLDRLEYIDGRLSDIAQENPRLDSEYSKLVAALPGLVTNRDNAIADYDAKEARARAAEATTAASLAKYREIRQTYDNRLAAAVAKGRGQGLPIGQAEGTPAGTAAGRAQGTAEGTRDGTAEGRAWGQAQGVTDGRAKGDIDGYAHGRNLPANFEAGRVEGYAQGMRDAEAQALREDYPAARAARRKEIFANVPTRVVEFDAKGTSTLALNLDARSTMMNARTLGNEFSTLSGGELRPIPGGLMAAFGVDVGRADCNLGYVDFVKACQEAFSKAYDETYASSYSVAHRDARAIAYRDSKAEAFEQHKMDLYQANYDAAYAAAYATADLRGAADAKAEGYATGKKTGYAERLPSARSEASAKGLADENAHFDANAVLQLLNAAVVKTSGSGSLSAGDAFSVQVDLANFGGVAAAKGKVKIQVVPATDNVSVETGVISLMALPGETLSRVKRVALGRINTTTGAESVKLKVIATMPDGSKQEKIVTVQTKLHIFAGMQLELNMKPWINQGIFAPKAHVVKVQVKNPRSFASTKGFNVSLELPKLNGVVIEAGQVTTSALGAGASTTVELRYKLTDRELGKNGRKLPLKVKIMYDGKLSVEQTVEIQPFNGL